MYNPTPEQAVAEAALEKQGFRFANWIPAEPDANGEPSTEHGCMVLIRRPNRFTREYRQIEPDGTVN